jgi:hypothetical protein
MGKADRIQKAGDRIRKQGSGFRKTGEPPTDHTDEHGCGRRWKRLTTPLLPPAG